MSMNDSIASALSKIETYDKLGRNNVEVTPSSKLLIRILDLLNGVGYVGTYELIDNKRGGIINLNLINKVNRCGVIKPRFSCELNEYEKFEKRYLLAKNFGVLIVSTSQGLMTHYEAKDKKIGGKLIAFCY
jgi:small subunit ribosomal protein S8